MKNLKLWINSQTRAVHWDENPGEGDIEATPDEASQAHANYFRGLTLDAFKLRMGLLHAREYGIVDIVLYDRVEELVAAAPDPVMRITWNALTNISRGSRLIAYLLPLIPMSEDQMDQVFEKASLANYTALDQPVTPES